MKRNEKDDKNNAFRWKMMKIRNKKGGFIIFNLPSSSTVNITTISC